MTSLQQGFTLSSFSSTLTLSIIVGAGVLMVHKLQPKLPAAPVAVAAPVIVPLVDKVGQQKTALTSYLSTKHHQSISVVRQYVDLAWAEARKHPHVSPELILAVMQKESELRANAESDYGAKGLMQVVPRYHENRLRARESITEPRVNIRVGAEILQEYLGSASGDFRRALRKYSGNAAGYAESILSEKTRLQTIMLNSIS